MLTNNYKKALCMVFAFLLVISIQAQADADGADLLEKITAGGLTEGGVDGKKALSVALELSPGEFPTDKETAEGYTEETSTDFTSEYTKETDEGKIEKFDEIVEKHSETKEPEVKEYTKEIPSKETPETPSKEYGVKEPETPTKEIPTKEYDFGKYAKEGDSEWGTSTGTSQGSVGDTWKADYTATQMPTMNTGNFNTGNSFAGATPNIGSHFSGVKNQANFNMPDIKSHFNNAAVN